MVRPKEGARFVTFECADHYTILLSLLEPSDDDVLLGLDLTESPLEKGYGFPLRPLVPSKYGFPGREKRRLSDSAGIWKNERFY